VQFATRLVASPDECVIEQLDRRSLPDRIVVARARRKRHFELVPGEFDPAQRKPAACGLVGQMDAVEEGQQPHAAPVVDG